MSPEQIITEWSSATPRVAAALQELAALPEHSVERLEAEAGLHMLQARWCWRRADRLREAQRADEQRRARKAAKAAGGAP